jgi:ABC-type multidrug transport system fused ATPase/permease subunit
MSTVLRLWPFLSKYKKWLLLSAFCHVFMAIFTVVSVPLIIPFFRILFSSNSSEDSITSLSQVEGRLSLFFTELIQNYGPQTSMLIVCFALVLAFLFRNLFRYLSLISIAPLRNGVIKDIRIELHDSLLNLPLKYINNERKGDLISRATLDIQEIDWSILSILEAVFKSPFIIVGSLSFMVLINVKLTLFAMCLMVFTGVVVSGISRLLKRDSHNLQVKIGEIGAILEESLHGLKIIKIFSAQKLRKSAYETASNDLNNQSILYSKKRELSSPVSEFLGVSTVVVLLWYGAQMVLRFEILPETFFAFILAFYQLIEPSKQLSNAIFSFQKGNAALDRVEEVLCLEKEESTEQLLENKTRFESSLTLTNVSFTYNHGIKPALTNIHLSLKKGEKIAIVGSSGSGKSTLVDLILRLYHDYEGTILIDQKDIKTINLNSYRNLFGVVTQEPILFNDTIESNVALSRDVNREKLIHALSTANALNFVNEKEGSILFKIGDRGNKLSGGEKQRITIARAIYNDPAILIFDEATSSLDGESENVVRMALELAMKDRTTIIVAHKLSTIKNVDRIIVLEDGRIVEEGSFDELIKRQGVFNRYWLANNF